MEQADIRADIERASRLPSQVRIGVSELSQGDCGRSLIANDAQGPQKRERIIGVYAPLIAALAISGA